jgi:hypothetical protein
MIMVPSSLCVSKAPARRHRLRIRGLHVDWMRFAPPPYSRANQVAPLMLCAGEEESRFCVCFDEEESPLCTAIVSVAESYVL